MSSYSELLYPMHALMRDRDDQDAARHTLDGFLAEVERRAFVMAEIATRNREDALDIVQDAMLAFVRRYSDKPETEWAPLFYRVLQNRIRDWARRRSVRNRWISWLQREEDNGSDPIQEAVDPNAVPVEQHLDDVNATKKLIEAVANLPLRQQQAFLLRIWEGLDVKSTARAMGCSEGSVKTHLYRALNALRDQLGAYRP